MTRNICESLSSFLAMDILAKAQDLERAGHRVIHLEIGQPDFETPECVNEAAIKALRDKKTGYTHSMGILPLREAIAEYYLREYGVQVDPEQVMVTSGSSPAMMMLFSMACDEGDKVIMADPAYACYENFVRFAGAEAVRLATREEQGFQLDPEAVKQAVGPRTKAILVNSPSNPAGSIISREHLTKLMQLGPFVVSDEIYHGLVYEGQAVSALEVAGADGNCAVLDGFSKRYAMTGWRLGWLVAPHSFMSTLQVLQQNFFISPNSISQWAGLAALTYADADVSRMRAEYAKRRLRLVEGLQKLGFGIRSKPVGAFYVLADARHLFKNNAQTDSVALAYDILEKAHVGATPGVDFGQRGEGYLRFSYANSLENIEEALQRLHTYLEHRL